MTRRSGCAILLFLAIVASAAAAWLLGTAAGARWLVGTVLRQFAIRTEIVRVEGSLAGGLRLGGMRLLWSSGYAEIGTVSLRWQPWYLLSGRIAARDLFLGDVVVQDNRPETSGATDLNWPRVSGAAALLDASIKALRVEGLSYKRMGNIPLYIRSLTAGASWREGRLEVESLSLDAVSFEAKGRLFAGFVRPFLNLDLQAGLSEPVLNLSRFSVKAALNESAPPEQISGHVALEGIAASGQITRLIAEAGITGTSLQIRDMRLAQTGRRGEILGRWDISFPAEGPSLRLHLSASHLDLSPEVARTDISGLLEFEGNPMTYKGRFSLSNDDGDIRSASVSGSMKGDRNGVGINDVKGSWLGGSVQGNMVMTWREELLLRADLQGRGLDPSRISPDWTGIVNLDLGGSLRRAEGAQMTGQVSGRLFNSWLRGRELKGEIEASLTDDTLIIAELGLHGNGFDITAAGDLRRRIRASASVSDLSGLIPGTQGRLRAAGWMRRLEGRLAAAASGKGQGLSMGGAQVKSMDFEMHLDGSPEGRLGLRSDINGIGYGGLRISSLSLNLGGTAREHTVAAGIRSSGAQIAMRLSGSYVDGTWVGNITELSGTDKVGRWGLESPAGISLSGEGLSLSPMLLRGHDEERIELNGDLSRRPLAWLLRLRWNRINLARADQWLADISLSGRSSGDLKASWSDGDLRSAAAELQVSGTVKAEGHAVEIKQGSVEFRWDDRGLVASLEVRLAEGVLSGLITSPEHVRAALPEQGKIRAEWKELDLALFLPWLPSDMELEGRASGRVEGRLLPARKIVLSGSGSISEGLVAVKKGRREFRARLPEARFSALWRDQTLSGDASLKLAEYGHLRLEYRVPLPALIPPTLNPEGPLMISADGRFRESGLLPALFPGLVEESTGELELMLRIGGTWGRPAMTGTLQLTRAGAYLPAAGIRLKEVGFTASLAGDTITIAPFHAKSGPGSIEGKATVRLTDWRVTAYSGNIKGDRFQFVHLPHLQVLVSPDLNFRGEQGGLAVRGEIAVPELVSTGSADPAAIEPSKDVIIVDAERPAGREPPMKLDVRVAVKLGDRVLVKAEGFDMRLGGGVEIAATGLNDIRGTGTINVAEGKYSTYGVSLEVTRGRVVFSGPADRPALDILAVRKVDEVSTGVLISGTPASPVVRLYSRPSMPDSDVMAYMVLGHRLGGDYKEASLVLRAAGALLSKSDSVVLEDQIRRGFGLDTLDIVSGGGEVSRSMVTAGKYLSPNLYISYGRSLFTDEGLLKLRYKLSRHWEVETQSGVESGADLFYKIEFR